MLKTELQSIVKNNYAIPNGLDEFQAVQQIVTVLGSTDPELRDELGMTILSKWLINQSYLTNEQLEELLHQTISEDFLFHKIGEVNTDSVFLRAFSTLLIALILYRDNQEQFLTEHSFRQAMKHLVTYCEQEKDLRGYVEGKGWAHAAAHVSDAVDECVRSRFTTFDECKDMCKGLFQLLIHAPFVYDAEEDERIVIAVVAMIELEKISLLDLTDWISEIEWSGLSEEWQRYQRVNCKHFLRSLYMRLREKKLLGENEHKLIELEHRFNPTFINI